MLIHLTDDHIKKGDAENTMSSNTINNSSQSEESAATPSLDGESLPVWTIEQDEQAQALARKFNLPFYLYRGYKGWNKRHFRDGDSDAADPVAVLMWKALQASEANTIVLAAACAVVSKGIASIHPQHANADNCLQCQMIIQLRNVILKTTGSLQVTA